MWVTNPNILNLESKNRNLSDELESQTNIYHVGTITTDQNETLFNSSTLLQLQGSNIHAVKVKAGCSYAIFTDVNGNHYSFGCNTLGSCGIESMSSANTTIKMELSAAERISTGNYGGSGSCNEKMVANVSEIDYFRKKLITIHQLFTNTISWSTYWLSSKNKLYGCGESDKYRFGTKSAKKRVLEPIFIKRPKNMGNIIDVQSGDFHSLYLDDKGNVYSTKYNSYDDYGGNCGQNGHSTTKK
eukprot:256255_1